MKAVILCALFAPIVYLALRQKKWYLYLLVAFIAVLPEQFSIKLHNSIPLLSATRILILIMIGFWLCDKWKTRKFQFPKVLILYLAVNLLVSLVNLRYGTQEIKRVFLLIFERVLLVIMLMDMIHDREEFNRCIDFAIMGCAALAVMGIVQTVFDYDISSALHLAKTITSTQLTQRMGLTRAFGTYNAISYGGYCAVMCLLIIYRLYNTRSIWHSAVLALTFAAFICTFTRSAWLCFAAVAFIALLVYRSKLIRRLLPGVAMTLALLALLCCCQPKLFSAFVETGKSSINTVLNIIPDSVVELFVPEETEKATQPAETKPAETKPAETKPAEIKPAETKPAETKPAETKPAETKPAETKPAETKPAETKPAETKPAETKPAETKPAEPKPTEPKPTEPKPTTPRPGFELDNDFGANAKDPTYSRTAQWTAVKYMAEEGTLLFGYGYNALPRGKIHFFFDRWAAKWQPTTFLDVGLVALIAESGILGAVAYVGLLLYMLVYAFIKKPACRKKEMDFFWVVIFMIPLYLLLNFLASFLHMQIVWIFIGLFFVYKKLGETEDLAAKPEQKEA